MRSLALTQSDFSPAALWAYARALFSMMADAIGAPQDVMNLVRLSAKERRAILAWLEPLEDLVRKLLLIAAAAWKPTRRILQRARARRIERKSFSINLRACFRVPLDESARADCARPFKIRRRGSLVSGVKLGLRYAALRAVLANPAPFARRLARRLAGNVGAARALAVSIPAKQSFAADAIACAGLQAECAAPAFANTS